MPTLFVENFATPIREKNVSEKSSDVGWIVPMEYWRPRKANPKGITFWVTRSTGVARAPSLSLPNG